MNSRHVNALILLVLGTPAVVAGVLMMAFLEDQPFVRWVLGILLLAFGIMFLAFIPRLLRERPPEDHTFQPLRADGQPVSGSPAVQRMAWVIHRELANVPHEVSTAPDAVRVDLVSGPVPQPSTHAVRHFTWRTTLAATANPNAFMRFDQEADVTRNGAWGRVRTSTGRSWGGSVEVTIDRDGRKVTRSASTSPIDRAVSAAVTESGVRLAPSTATIVGLSAGIMGVLVAIASMLVALFP